MSNKDKTKLDVEQLKNDVINSGKNGFIEKAILKLANKYEKLEQERIEEENEVQENPISKEEKRKQLIRDIIGYTLGAITGIVIAILLTKLGK